MLTMVRTKMRVEVAAESMQYWQMAWITTSWRETKYAEKRRAPVARGARILRRRALRVSK